MNKMIRESIFGVCFLGLLQAILPAAVSAATYQSHWLEVQVVNKQTGEPVSDAAVCLGTSARPDQIGALRTGEDGVVRFNDLLRNPLLLTASGPGYQGREQLLDPIRQSRVMVFKIARGGGGPVCDAPSQEAGQVETGGLGIRDVKIQADPSGGDSGRILVAVSVAGTANQVRISEKADFSDSGWKNLQPSVAHTLGGSKGVKRVYVQVRRKMGTEGATLQVVSPVKQVRYHWR